MKKLLVFIVLFPSLCSAQTWTVTVAGKTSDNQGNQIVSLHFSSDQGQVYDVDDRIPLGASPTQLADFAASVIFNLKAQQVAFSTAPLVGQVVTPTPTTTPIIDPKAAAKAQFLADYLLLKQMQTAINHQILTATDASFVAQLATVTSELAADKATMLSLIQTGP